MAIFVVAIVVGIGIGGQYVFVFSFKQQPQLSKTYNNKIVL